MSVGCPSRTIVSFTYFFWRSASRPPGTFRVAEKKRGVLECSASLSLSSVLLAESSGGNFTPLNPLLLSSTLLSSGEHAEAWTSLGNSPYRNGFGPVSSTGHK